MVVFKKIDAYGQVILILGLILLSLLWHSEVIYASYTLVGCWQTISALCHFIKRKNLIKLKQRRKYEIFLLIAIITLPLGSYFVLIFIAPCTALWYIVISFRELRIWQHRQFIQLR